MELGIDD